MSTFQFRFASFSLNYIGNNKKTITIQQKQICFWTKHEKKTQYVVLKKQKTKYNPNFWLLLLLLLSSCHFQQNKTIFFILKTILNTFFNFIFKKKRFSIIIKQKPNFQYHFNHFYSLNQSNGFLNPLR